MPIPMKRGRPARVDYERHRQPVHVVRAARRLAPRRGDGPPHCHRLCSRLEGFWLITTSRTSRPSCWSRTISISTARHRSTRRLVERFEWHYTPKHGSWLNLAESELGVLSTQGLDRRIPDQQTLIEEIAAWENDRNAHHTKADCQFTTKTARLKLKHLYPSI